MNTKKLSGLAAVLAAIAAAFVAKHTLGGHKPTPAPPPIVQPAKTGYLAVWVTDAAHRPITGASVHVAPAADLPDTNGDGWSGGVLPLGDYSVLVSADDFVSTDQRVTVRDDSAGLRVTLERLAPPILPLSTRGPIFLQAGQPWRWKGVSAFALLDRFAKGQDIADTLTAYHGYNVLRVWLYTPAKDWGDRAWETPSADVVLAFLQRVARAGFYVELTLLTDDDPARLEPARRLIAALAAARPANLLLEAGNEPTTHKVIDTHALKGALDASGFLYSSGDYEDSSRFFGSFLTAHTGRDSEWPRRAHDLLEYYGGGGPNAPSDPAHRVPVVADEPAKPQDVGGNRVLDFRAYFGACALLGAGATFHSETGKFGLPPTADEAQLAAIALEALNAFPADAPLGPYGRPVEQSLRTYTVGAFMVRVRPASPAYTGGGDWHALDSDGVLWRR